MSWSEFRKFINVKVNRKKKIIKLNNYKNLW